MKSEWLADAILRAASLLAPGDERAEWLAGWRSELWYVPQRGAARFCLGSFLDALWLRRDCQGSWLESPRVCLAWLALLAVVGSVVAVWVPSRLTARGLPEGWVGMLMLSGLALPAVRLALGPQADRYPIPWRGRLRRGIFLALKIALLQPALFGGFVVMIAIGPVAPFVGQAGFNASWILAFRWVLMDQRRRCPECLRLLTEPVRIGNSSQTFLEWYGSESLCARGHGLLHAAEAPASYSETPRWLRLGDSWSGL